MKNKEKVKMGKKSRAAGGRFERKVRADLERNWIVSKWQDNVEINLEGCGISIPVDSSDKNSESWQCGQYYDALKKKMYCGKCVGKLVPAKQGRFRMTSTGFPDFIAFRLAKEFVPETEKLKEIYLKLTNHPYHVFGVESKMNGILDKEEKAKCKWLLEKNIFSKILIAKKGKKRGEIEYVEFK